MGIARTFIISLMAFTVYQPFTSDEGGLMSYGHTYDELFRRGAVYVDASGPCSK
jgi:hypothetical protein